jgi:DNA mismatch endonuclease (patch repair protein)
LPGRPDLVFIGPRLAVFVDGCFWHGCTICRNRPATNREFWERKINGTIQRDAETNSRLADLGWKVVRIWEHEVRGDLQPLVSRIMELVRVDKEK